MLRNWRIDQVGKYIPRGVSLLDIGTGDGAIFERLGQITRGIGIDPQVPKVTTVGHYTLLPGYFPEGFISDEKFDVITMLAVMEHIRRSDYDRLVKACAQFLKPKGILIITVPSSAADSLLKLLLLLKVVDGIKLEEHHGFVPAQIQEIFSKPFFRQVYHERFQMGFNNLFVFGKILCH